MACFSSPTEDPLEISYVGVVRFRDPTDPTASVRGEECFYRPKTSHTAFRQSFVLQECLVNDRLNGSLEYEDGLSSRSESYHESRLHSKGWMNARKTTWLGTDLM